MKKFHTPKAHANHEKFNNECGCWTEGQKGRVAICDCGAAYMYSEVLTFPIWRCYDCNTAYIKKIIDYTK